MVDNRPRYVVQHNVLVLRIWHLVEPVSDRHLRPACQQHPQPGPRWRSSLGQQLHDDANVAVAVALVERIYNQDERGWAVTVAKLRQRTENKVLPLVAQRLAGNVVALCNSVADMLPHRWHAVRELHCNARHKLAGVPNVAAATREEEAGC
jgi:hypothetical protein